MRNKRGHDYENTVLYSSAYFLLPAAHTIFGMKYKIVPAEPAMVTATPVLSPTEGMITTSPGAPSTPSATATVDETAVLWRAVNKGWSSNTGRMQTVSMLPSQPFRMVMPKEWHHRRAAADCGLPPKSVAYGNWCGTGTVSLTARH